MGSDGPPWEVMDRHGNGGTVMDVVDRQCELIDHHVNWWTIMLSDGLSWKWWTAI